MAWGFVPQGRDSSLGYLYLLGYFLFRVEDSSGDKCGSEKVTVTLPTDEGTIQ